MSSVYAVVVTRNRRRLLLGCLEALAAQTHPLDGVLVVDNASSDGTVEAIVAGGLPDRLALDYLRLERNGGGSEGFHYGVLHALRREVDWIWLMDDDCEPSTDALERLLAAPRARDAGAALLAPIVRGADGAVLALNRGWLRRRWFRAPLVGLSAEDCARAETEVEHVSLVGPLVRRALAARVEPPRRDFFIWYDDLEWVSRLRRIGSLWLIPASEIVHLDERPLASTDLGSRWRDFARGERFDRSWKRTYGLRNMVYCGRREGYVGAGQAVSYVAVAALRALLFESPRARVAWLMALYARDGWRGRFRNLDPERWPALARERRPLRYIDREALRYDRPVAGEPRALA
ncbi:MAG: glycosyltransferase family 2 protein [Thermoleophilaceae bacterium]